MTQKLDPDFSTVNGDIWHRCYVKFCANQTCSFQERITDRPTNACDHNKNVQESHFLIIMDMGQLSVCLASPIPYPVPSLLAAIASSTHIAWMLLVHSNTWNTRWRCRPTRRCGSRSAVFWGVAGDRRCRSSARHRTDRVDVPCTSGRLRLPDADVVRAAAECTVSGQQWTAN